MPGDLKSPGGVLISVSNLDLFSVGETCPHTWHFLQPNYSTAPDKPLFVLSLVELRRPELRFSTELLNFLPYLCRSARPSSTLFLLFLSGG